MILIFSFLICVFIMEGPLGCVIFRCLGFCSLICSIEIPAISLFENKDYIPKFCVLCGSDNIPKCCMYSFHIALLMAIYYGNNVMFFFTLLLCSQSNWTKYLSYAVLQMRSTGLGYPKFLGITTSSQQGQWRDVSGKSSDSKCSLYYAVYATISILLKFKISQMLRAFYTIAYIFLSAM